MLSRAGDVGAQRAVEIADQEACLACDVVLSPIATLIPGEGASFTTLPPISIASDTDGWYYVGPLAADSVIGAFTPDGTFDHLYGRVGPGPREFAGPPFPALLRVDDQGVLYVVQASDLHVLEARATATLRKDRLPVRPQDAAIVGNEIVVQAPIRRDGGVSLLQVLGEGRAVERGFDAVAQGQVTHAGDLLYQRRITPAREVVGGVWSGQVGRYQISRWSLGAGVEQVRLVRTTDWFPPYSSPLPGELWRVPQRPRVASIHQDRDGLLWVAVTHGDAQFEPLEERSGGEQRLDVSVDLNRYLDTTIEVLDPSNGVIVARRTFDEHLRFVSTANGDVLLYAFLPDENGELRGQISEGAIRRD